MTRQPRAAQGPRASVRSLALWVRHRAHRLPDPAYRCAVAITRLIPRIALLRLKGLFLDKDLVAQAKVRPTLDDGTVRVVIGPANFAGQGYQWARAIEREYPQARAAGYSLHVPGGFAFVNDYIVSPKVYRGSREWQAEHLEWTLGNATHVVIEACRPLFGDRFRTNPFREADYLERHGVAVAMMQHGSDIRVPSIHAEKYPWSPYRNKEWVEIPRLERASKRNLARLSGFAGPIFVSTPDLLEFIPHAHWCPAVVDVPLWRKAKSTEINKPLVVAHAPSKAHTKGSMLADSAMGLLGKQGMIVYQRVGGVPAKEMPQVYGSADVVLNQFLLGSYGVAACEAMAAGCVVIGNVTEDVRAVVKRETGLDLPIVQADPHNIADVVSALVDDPQRVAAIGIASQTFVNEVHSGTRSARVIGQAFDWGAS